jgi:penicillin-binding protein 1B
MAIEVTSVPDRHRPFSPKKLWHFVTCEPGIATSRGCRIVVHPIVALLLISLVTGGDYLIACYKYYSRIIDARLESGYLTSRPGIYAAPRTIHVGQGMDRDAFVAVLRRAGYVNGNASDVWNGSFSMQDQTIKIRAGVTRKPGDPTVVRVGFDGAGQISELTGDGVPLTSFTLEPEVLTNDLSIKTGKREALAYDDIPPILVHAILSAEDRRFFDHSGLDLFGVARALIRNAGDERVGQGGSTITQQLVKNTYLSSERTLSRKFAEAILALALERRVSKQDIFALYCNEIYFGVRGSVAVRGVQQAAKVYFDKELSDLSLSELATIAGMIQGPARYSPHQHPEGTRTRRNTVLLAMARDGWITAQEALTTANQPITVATPGAPNESLAPYFIDYVNRLVELEADSENQRIYSTIDLDLQELAETAVKNQLNKLNLLYKNPDEKPQAALVALDPRTGNVLAMVGGRNYAKSQLNHATDAQRQLGSTFKPFVYAAALESGISPVQMFSDAPSEFTYSHNKTYRPANFGGQYSQGEVTMRSGLVKSLNVVTVDVAMQTGLARTANLAEKFGLPKPERYPALALGTSGANPLQLAAAYATFVNGGRSIVPKVITSMGEPPAIHALKDSRDTQVISPTTAYMISNMLAAVIDHGTGRAARGAVKGTSIAGKTGTSRDGWFVGYTPNLVCVVWIGFDDDRQLGLTGAQAALPAWAEFIKGAVDLRPELGGRNFECPEGIKFVEIDADTGLLSTLSCPNRELIAVTDALAPNLECYKHGNLQDIDDSSNTGTRSVEVNDLAQHRKITIAKPSSATSAARFGETRIEMNTRGRQTLVNAMR